MEEMKLKGMKIAILTSEMYEDQDFVVDGNLITAGTKQALPEFSRAFIGALASNC